MYKTVDDDSMEWNPKETGKKTKERGKRNRVTVTEETRAIYLFFQNAQTTMGAWDVEKERVYVFSGCVKGHRMGPLI